MMLEVISELVASESCALSTYTPPDNLKILLYPAGFAPEAYVKAAANYVHQSPFSPYHLATQDATWKMESDFMPLEEFHKTDWHQKILAPNGVNYQMAGILGLIDGTAHTLSIHKHSDGFTERDREVLNALHPHLVTSYINALVSSRAHESTAQVKAAMETAPGAYGYFDASGKLAWLQAKAELWLQEFFPDEVKSLEKIPRSVQVLLQESFADGPPAKLLEKKNAEEILTVCIGGSPLGGRILRLERKSQKPLPRFRHIPNLSDRQNDVLQWMVEGKRNGEIAAILGISERTVERHVTEILVGLQAENRATAIVRALEFSAAAKMAEAASEAAFG